MIGEYCKTLVFPASMPNALGGSWMHLVFLGLLVSALLMTLMYMLSRAMRIPRLEGWARHEFFQILATAGLAAICVWLVWGMCSFNISFLSTDLYGASSGADVMSACGASPQYNAQGQAIITPYCAAKAYLAKLKARGEVLFTSLVGLNGALSYLFRITWESRPLGIGYTLEPLAGLQQIQNVFLVGVSGFMVSYLSIIIQTRILDYMIAAVPYYFMPLGLLLRAFTPTREFGGALMGFSIASLLFFPLILVANDLIIYTSLDEITAPKDSNGVPIDLVSQLDGSNTQATILPAQDLGLLRVGDSLGGVTIGSITAQQSDQLIFQSAAAGSPTYVAILSGTPPTVTLSPLNGTINTPAAGAAINEYWGMYEPQPDAQGEWTPRTSSSGTPIRYFTDPDPSAPNEPIGLTSKALANSILWPTQMIMVFSIAAVLMPIINFMIFIEIARGLTGLLGAEMDLSNLTRMI